MTQFYYDLPNQIKNIYQKKAKEQGYTHDFGYNLEKSIDGYSKADIKEVKKVFEARYNNIVFLGVPATGYEVIARVLHEAFAKPIADFNTQVERTIFDLVLTGTIKNKNGFRSKNKQTNGSYTETALFDATYSEVQELSWTKLVEAHISQKAIPFYAGAKIINYPILFKKLKDAGKTFVHIKPPKTLEEYKKMMGIASKNESVKSNMKHYKDLSKEDFEDYLEKTLKRDGPIEKASDFSIDYNPNVIEMIKQTAEKLKGR
ncbi:MAG: hypothetical protein ACTSUM_00655 [Alphaproteobacteria bacterium]|nr:MAG: hypothetical protein B6I23_00115 [Rickettsiaceae bacterium 4572_127]